MKNTNTKAARIAKMIDEALSERMPALHKRIDDLAELLERTARTVIRHPAFNKFYGPAEAQRLMKEIAKISKADA